MSPPVEPLTYNDLSEVSRNELRLKNLVGVRPDFYPSIRECRERMKSDYEREYAIDPFSTKTKLAAKQLTEFTDLVEMTFDARMKKIQAMALRAAEGIKADTAKLTREEKDLFDAMYNLLRDSHATLIEGKPSKPIETDLPTSYPKVEERREPAAPPTVAPPIAKPEPVTAPAAPPTTPLSEPPKPNVVIKPPPSATKTPDLPPAVVAPPPTAPVADRAAAPTLVLLRILEDLPPFAASDRNYNLKKEDVVSLPPAIAKTLIARKKAIGVQHSELPR